MKSCKISELKPGDWFESEGERYICLFIETSRRLYLGWNPKRYTIGFKHVSEVIPLPECTGWDWEPEPEILFRKEFAISKEHLKGGIMWTQWIEKPPECDLDTQRDDYIGYTIRRTWPNGRVEQEFVPKSLADF